MKDDNLNETIEFLEGNGLPLVCVDMPQGFKSSLPPVAAATADLAVVRFHGRNSDRLGIGLGPEDGSSTSTPRRN